MTQRPLSLLIVLGTAALALAGCKTETASRSPSSRDVQPIPAKVEALMAEKGMRKEDPILVRVYKEDSKLEVWKKRQADGRFALLKSYEICRWSGGLGPKKAEGDRQAPEGFYAVTPGQMNPKSAYYLSFDTGFPNAYDKSLGRTGKNLMVHGDCLSSGCYAMTDPQMAEVYAIAREAFRGGQKSFQFQAMPFRMTAENLARRRNDPNLAFWKNLKEGSDHFEVTKLEPKVNVCGKKYVFDAKSKNGSFDANADCPGYEVEPSIAVAVAPKIKQDEQKFAQLVSSGVQVAEAYVPQNGRLRRKLGDPISNGAVMMASAEPADVPLTPVPRQPAVSLALADVKAPQPAPSPYPEAKPVAPAAAAAPSSRLLAFARPDKAAELQTAQTPAATPASETPEAAQRGAVAAAERQVALQPPMTASLGPSSSSNYKPFYKRMLGFGGGDAATGPVVVAAPPGPILPPEPQVAVAKPAAPKPVARPAVAAAAPAPKVAAVPAPKTQAVAAAPKVQPPAQTASAAPQLPQSDFGLMSGAPILGTGTFTR